MTANWRNAIEDDQHAEDLTSDTECYCNDCDWGGVLSELMGKPSATHWGICPKCGSDSIDLEED